MASKLESRVPAMEGRVRKHDREIALMGTQRNGNQEETYRQGESSDFQSVESWNVFGTRGIRAGNQNQAPEDRYGDHRPWIAHLDQAAGTDWQANVMVPAC